MARPRKPRTLEGPPRPLLYLPAGWTRHRRPPAEVALEDFEVMRLVDGHAHGLVEAAAKVGVSRSTAGRMLERARRAVALALERRAPLYIDAAEAGSLHPPGEPLPPPGPGGEAVLAVAVDRAAADARVARVFGRAAAFALVGASGEIAFLPNPAARRKRDVAHGAAASLRERRVRRVVAGRYGPEAMEGLGLAGIEPLVAAEIDLRQAVELFGIMETEL